jgi:hypothetical protein
MEQLAVTELYYRLGELLDNSSVDCQSAPDDFWIPKERKSVSDSRGRITR